MLTNQNFRGLRPQLTHRTMVDLRDGAEAIDQAMREVADLLDNATWSGDDAELFMKKWNTYYPEIYRTVTEMRQKAMELEDVICKQEQASETS